MQDQLKKVREALEAYADKDNWLKAEGAVSRQVWIEPDSSTPESYDGWELAAKALAALSAAPETQEQPNGWKLAPLSPTVPMIQRAAQHITNGDELDNPRDRHEVIGRLHAIWTDMLAAAPVQPASKPEVVAYMQPNGNTISVQRLNEGLNRQQFVQDIWKDAIPLTRCNTSSKPEASEAAQEPGRIDTPKFREVLYAYSAGRVSTQHFIWYIEEHCARQISAAQPAPARDAQTDFEAYWNSLADDPSASAEIVMSCKYAAAEAWKAALQSQPAPEAGKSESAPAQAVTDEQILEMARQCSISEHGQIFEFARRLLGSAKTQGDAA